jgi:hypothetical protein
LADEQGILILAIIDDELPAPARARIEEIVRRLAADDIDGLRSEGVKGLEGDPLLWVREYPAKLVPLPGDVWRHPEADASPLMTGAGGGSSYRSRPRLSHRATCRWKCQ